MTTLHKESQGQLNYCRCCELHDPQIISCQNYSNEISINHYSAGNITADECFRPAFGFFGKTRVDNGHGHIDAVVKSGKKCERLRGGGSNGLGDGSGTGSGLSTGSGDGSTGNDRGYSNCGSHSNIAEDSRGLSRVSGPRRNSFDGRNSPNEFEKEQSYGFRVNGECNSVVKRAIGAGSSHTEGANSFAVNYFGMEEDSANKRTDDFHKKYDSDFSVYCEIAKGSSNRRGDDSGFENGGGDDGFAHRGGGVSFGGRGDDHYSQRDGGFGGRGDGDVCIRDDGGFAVRGHSRLGIREYGAFGSKYDGGFENRDNGTFGEGGDNGLEISDEGGFVGRGDGGFRNRDGSGFRRGGDTAYEDRHDGGIPRSADEAVFTRRVDRFPGSRGAPEKQEPNFVFNTESRANSNGQYNQYNQKNRSKSSGYSG